MDFLSTLSFDRLRKGRGTVSWGIRVPFLQLVAHIAHLRVQRSSLGEKMEVDVLEGQFGRAKLGFGISLASLHY